MIRSIIICTALALTLATQATADKEPQVPCGRLCSEIYGSKWNECKGVQQCQAYIEAQYKSCFKKCEAERKWSCLI